MFIIPGNEHDDLSSNVGWDWISDSSNTLGKAMNPIIFPPSMSK